ncbi:P-loop containing nucleoside triphosphate hydrolase protein [Hygrophoropsis aurantiaca]|uniref:P-loop containing nucleoside triphosphate hydrolase protein n=1 Tax=Hygrophoropsis aurantiaca TaxID=72124 RepID=A0ACB8A8Q1_9AGAM|nr:P-loop containing nucleoside triphosphate hydrolase protein [Hygrophoropsis aurantiaca]
MDDQFHSGCTINQCHIPCPSCCSICRAKSFERNTGEIVSIVTVPQPEDEHDPLALSKLISAGTIIIEAPRARIPCNHNHASDGWHFLPPWNHRPEDTLFFYITFLAEHLFIRATYRYDVTEKTVHLRIYLIPRDHQNMHGQLHNCAPSVMKIAKSRLQEVLSQIRLNPEYWDAKELVPVSSPPIYLLSKTSDNRTMADVYNTMHSPTTVPTSQYHEWGLRTGLYHYQRQTVDAMIERESTSKPITDPLFVPVFGVRGDQFFIFPSTWEIRRECPLVSRNCGGILCEELGTGKTLMILALILSTAEELPDPEQSLEHLHTVLTPLTHHSFLPPEHPMGRKNPRGNSQCLQQVPSLVELLLDYIGKSQINLGLRQREDQLEGSSLLRQIQMNTPFFYSYDRDVISKSIARQRPNKHSPSRIMYLTRATLVIVPLNLLGQWDREILKHCNSSLRYLIVQQSTKLPAARVLASNYDVIVMSDTRFRTEAKLNQLNRLYNLKNCSCPMLPDTRIPDCSCQSIPEVTPLLQMRWKRLVIDEGHISSNITGAINFFVRQLSIQSKWIVTGTPTSNILGLNLGQQSDSTDAESPPSSEHDFEQSSSESSTPALDNEGSVTRVWGKYEYENLRKLAHMIGDFLAVPQFKADPKSFGVNVISPLCCNHGPRFGAIKVLSQVMEMVMVRHRVEDVERDVKLEPMTHEIILMDLDPFALKSYNAMQASIAINAIDSQRKDQDYIFHDRNAKALQNATDNISQSLFWSASNILYNVDQICREADEFLDHAIQRGVSESDMELLKQALTQARSAAEDKLWRAMQYHEDVPFQTSDMDSQVFEAWTRGQLMLPSRDLNLIHANRLVELRDQVRKRPLASTIFMVTQGNLINEQERRIRSDVQTKKMVTEVNIELGIAPSKAHDVDEIGEITADPQTSNMSPLSGVRVRGSLSTKLNYVLNEVLKHSRKEKFLIFSKSPLTLAHVAEGLSLVEVKYLRYTMDVTPAQREQFVMTFETSETFRVFLIQLKLGARGLNLVSASRVIFCEPVWRPDEESQAIKRAHRIGQTKPITVKTLVIRSTAEEAMINRRQHFKGVAYKIPTMMTDSGMRHFIENPQFLDQVADSGPSLDFAFLDHMSANAAQEDVGTSTVDVTAVEASRDDELIDHPSQPPRKKAKGVRFADEPSDGFSHS